MQLTLYNTLSRRKEPFEPLDPANVRMYVCGPTVYDYAHIGNARPVIVFDVLFRLLRHIYGEKHVTYVRNITDVDDKINARAAEEYPDLPLNEAIRRVTTATEKQFHEDIAALGVLPPTVEPRATEHIAEMKALCEALVERGHAYIAEEHVLFNVPSMKDYGRLSNRSLEEMEAGARVEVAPYKRDPMDFVLWKPSKPGEPAWPSPSGIKTPGRPGWHIECSAMADRWLWAEAKSGLSKAGLAHPHEFDIHGGGIDLVFPHHENEIAQSRCAHGTPVMARYWLHNGFLQVEGEKMSKSLGNFVTIHELLETDKFGGHSWTGEVLRLAMLKTHYRQPIDWTLVALNEARSELQAWAAVLFNSEAMFQSIGRRADAQAPVPADEIVHALCDDLNTPQVLAALRSLFSRAKRDDRATAIFLESLEFLGLVRSGKLFAHNPHHVRKGERIIQESLKPVLDHIQVAAANGNTALVQKLIEEMAARGVCAEVREDGAVSYEVIDQSGGTAVDQINRLIAARIAARKAKDFKESDRIRDELAAMGIQLKDSKNPQTGEIETTWEVAR